MKIKHKAASRSCLCTSCHFRKLHQIGPKIDKNYYGKFISLRERILLGKLFGAVYDDIIQMLPTSNARYDILTERKSYMNLQLDEENIKVAKSSLIGHALKIIKTDKTMQSDKLSECYNCCTYGSALFPEHNLLHTHGNYGSREAIGSRIKGEPPRAKQQTRQMYPDLNTSELSGWEEKEPRIETKMLDINYMTRYDHPFKIFNENEMTFRKKDIEVRQTKLPGGMKPASPKPTKLKIGRSPPITHPYKIETSANVPLQNIENETSETIKQLFVRLKQTPPVIHRPPYNFMITPRISLYSINRPETKNKKKIDKDATGDTTQKTHKKNITNPYDQFSLKSSIKPQNNKIDLLVLANAMRKLTSKPSLQSKSVSGRSKIIKRSKKNKTVIAKTRQRPHHNCYIVDEKAEFPKQGINLSFHIDPAVEVSVKKSVNNFNVNNNHIIRTWEKTNATEKGRNNRIINYVENPPPTCGLVMNSLTNHSLRRCFCTFKLDKSHTKNCCKSRKSLPLRQSTPPASKYQKSYINNASVKDFKINKCNNSLDECDLSYNLISHRFLDFKPEIIVLDKFKSNYQNTIHKKTSLYECKHGNVHDKEYNPQEKVEKLNEIEQNKLHIFETDHPETKPTVSTKNPIGHIMAETVQFKQQVISGPNFKQILVAPKRNQAVQINSSSSFEIEFCKETPSPITCDAKINTYRRPFKQTEKQEIQNVKLNQSSETNNNSDENIYVQSNLRNCFCTLNDKDTLNSTLKKSCTSFWKDKNPRKEDTKSFYQDTILHRDTLNHFDLDTDISRNKSFSFTTIKQRMNTNFNKNHSDASSVKKQQLSSETNNIFFSRRPKCRKNEKLYVPNDNPYLIHGVSNKYRHDNSVVNLHKIPVKCKTSSSSFSSIIGATTTTTTDSSHSFPREKYKNNRQRTSNGVNSEYYKSSFYALFIKVKNTHGNERKYKLEPYECEPGACYPAPGKCDPIECDKLIKQRLARKTTKNATDDRSQSISSGPGVLNSNNAASTANRHQNDSAKTARQGLQYRNLPISRSRRGAKQAVRISSSFSFNIEFSKNTAPAHDIHSGREKHSGKEKRSGKEKKSGKEKQSGKVQHAGREKSKISQKSTGGGRHPSDKKYLNTEPTGETQYSNACLETCPKCLNIGTYCPCPKLQHTESQSEPEMQHIGINTQSKRCFCTLKLHKSGRIYRDRAVKAKKYKVKPKVYKERGHNARAGYEPDYDTITVADKEQNKRENLSNLELFECEPDTCIPGECDPYVCLERIKKRCQGIKDERQPMLATNTEKSTKTQLKENRNDESTKQVTRIGSNFSFNVEFYKNRTGFDSTHKAPRRKKRTRAKKKNQLGKDTTVAPDTEEDRRVPNTETPARNDDVATAQTPALSSGKPRNTKNIAIMMVKQNVDSGIQSTKELHHQDSQVNTPAGRQIGTKTGEFLQRCFCTAKLHGIKVPKELLNTQPEKKKSKCVIL